MSRKKVVLPKHLNDTEAIELIWGPPDDILTEAMMRPYQGWMSEKAQELDGVFLAAEMGLGKTGATLHAIAKMLAAGTIKHVLIVAPLKVAEETWPA